MKSKKQTAVNFLVNYMLENFHLTDESLQVFEQAKELHKRHIIDAVDYGCSSYGSQKDAEQYYKDTYKKD